MELKAFIKDGFGKLTTVTNSETGITMFFAYEVAEKFGHTNLTQAISRILDEKDYKKIELKKYPDFKHLLLVNKMLSGKASSIIMLSESGVYKLALSSNLDKAKPFKDWIASEVLPSIRKNGYYSIADQTGKILIHTNVNIQKQNSKNINHKNYIENGVDSVIEYNRKSCLLHTGKNPHDIKVLGRELGLKSIERTSAKEVLRHIKPEIACAMSFTDDLVNKGFDLNTVSELSLKCAIPLFQGMLELGINPKELE